MSKVNHGTKKQQLRKKRKYHRVSLIINTSLFMLTVLSTVIIILLAMYFAPNSVLRNYTFSVFNPPKTVEAIGDTKVNQMLLTPNPYSRPQTQLRKVNSVVIHYTANPGTDAKANRNYFENLRTNHDTYSSSHFVIGIEGEIVQCIPLDEISFASNDRNGDTISIECCHNDVTGKFTSKTYKSLVALTAWICKEYKLGEDNIIRHYDVSGKNCPLYYVKHEDKWLLFKEDVMKAVENNTANK